jgi:hypothetical protein
VVHWLWRGGGRLPSEDERKLSEGCGLKRPYYGLAMKGKKWWCAGCNEVKDAVSLLKA